MTVVVRRVPCRNCTISWIASGRRARPVPRLDRVCLRIAAAKLQRS